ncbi:hypothetical protein [Thiomicrorhabdus sp. Milos-T2]|uniref:hypothetical protein n=1 Tax=Thiomicrorhabdus sp. Milos-T2 TaxID=90814 RepID=UPI00068E8EB9|nr:hypothetical protein [Thiomicrorhabdus sp. Milos-T2]
MKPLKTVSNHSTNLILISSLTLGLFSSTSFANAPHPGKELHDSVNCMKCHAAKPYDPQKTTSYPKLVKTVAFCNSNLNTGLFEDEVEQIADYLNDTYYHHPKE